MEKKIIDFTTFLAKKWESKRRFYIRGTNSAVFCVIHQICINPPLPFYATQIINPFVNSIVSANHEKEKDFQPMEKLYAPYCFFSVESLLKAIIRTPYVCK